MKTPILHALVALLTTSSMAQDFIPDNSNQGDTGCRVDRDCPRDLVCSDSTCAPPPAPGGFNGSGGMDESCIDSGDMCMNGQTCCGGMTCPSCIMEPCTCPSSSESALRGAAVF
eukprot:scaffold45643_cov92-Cyclotella_meneghiniana.AAC.4